MSSRFHFSQQKTYFSQFLDKLLNLRYIIEYLVHLEVGNDNSLILHKLPILFLIVKLKSRHNYSHFMRWSYRDSGNFKCCSSWSSKFFSIHEKDGKLGVFLIQAWFVVLQISQFTKEFRRWDFWSPHDFMSC